MMSLINLFPVGWLPMHYFVSIYYTLFSMASQQLPYRVCRGCVALRKYHMNYSEVIFEWISEWNEYTEVFKVLFWITEWWWQKAIPEQSIFTRLPRRSVLSNGTKRHLYSKHRVGRVGGLAKCLLSGHLQLFNQHAKQMHPRNVKGLQEHEWI